jgi:hypothetical protein
MLMPRNPAGVFITLYMRSGFSRYMLFTSESIINFYFMICEAYHLPSHSCFNTAVIFKYSAAGILIQSCERMINTRAVDSD